MDDNDTHHKPDHEMEPYVDTVKTAEEDHPAPDSSSSSSPAAKPPISKTLVAGIALVVFVVIAAAILIPVLITQLGKDDDDDDDKRKDPFVRTALDDYVYEDDGVLGVVDMKISFASTAAGEDYTVHLYNFTSQRWLTEADSSQPIWWHILAVIVPANVNKSLDNALLFVSSGDNPDGVPNSENRDLRIAGRIAYLSNATAGVIFNVPNQPITLPDDPWVGYTTAGPRDEDALIGFTWWRAATTATATPATPSPPEMNLYLPMVKASLRAMDVLQIVIPRYINDDSYGASSLLAERKAFEEETLFTGNPHGDGSKRYDLSQLFNMSSNLSTPYINTIKTFTCAGISKRGWTAWLIAAAEARRGVKNDYADAKAKKTNFFTSNPSERLRNATLRHHPLVTTGDRVAAAVPIILDIVKLSDFFDRMHGSYGAWSFALWDYIMTNITEMMRTTPAIRDVMDLVDPYTYFGRFAGLVGASTNVREGNDDDGIASKAPTPFFIVSSGGDEFMLPDNHRFIKKYADEVLQTVKMGKKGEKAATTDMRFMLHNFNHNFEPAKADSIASFMVGIQQRQPRDEKKASPIMGPQQVQQPMPTVETSIDNATGRIRVRTSTTPKTVQIMQCDSAGNGLRDWRWAVYPGAARVQPWTTGADKEGIDFTSSTEFSALVSSPPPANQTEFTWRAFTVVVTFDSPIAGTPYTFTAPVSVLPDAMTLPFETCGFSSSSSKIGGESSECDTSMV